MNEKNLSDKFCVSMAHEGEAWIKWIALGTAFALHVAVMFVNLPQVAQATVRPETKTSVRVTPYLPPPPIEREPIVRRELNRQLPIPDPTPAEPEPIREPEPREVLEPAPLDSLMGIPEPPPPSGPVLPGVRGVSNPVLILETKVEPDYPELARVARQEGTVILQAIIRSDGTVGEIEVLRCNRPNLGFEDSAIEAVSRWLYEPAFQNGIPVDVYFTVVVDCPSDGGALSISSTRSHITRLTITSGSRPSITWTTARRTPGDFAPSKSGWPSSKQAVPATPT